MCHKCNMQNVGKSYGPPCYSWFLRRCCHSCEHVVLVLAWAPPLNEVCPKPVLKHHLKAHSFSLDIMNSYFASDWGQNIDKIHPTYTDVPYAYQSGDNVGLQRYQNPVG